MNGDPIISYKIYIATHNNASYALCLTECNGGTAIVAQNRMCIINLSTLTASPFNLVQNEPISVKVTATNTYGESVNSTVGTGAAIILVPSAPVNLTNDATYTNSSVIVFNFSPGASNGGSSVLYYNVYFDNGLGTNVFTLLQQYLASEFYVTSVRLNVGAFY